MKQRYFLVAVLSILILAATSTLAFAEDDSAHFSGDWEVGVTGVDIDDNPARVNEYGTYRSDDNGINLANKLNLEYLSKKFYFTLESDLKGPGDQQHSLEMEANRILRFGVDFSVLDHWKDKETLGHIGATMAPDVGGGQPRVGTNLTSNFGADYATLGEAQAQYYEEQSNDYLVTRKEWENEADLHLPQLPNVVFHTGLRIETREGMEQSITLSKCNACHIEANGKQISERTEDLSLGMTGKFGALTVEYEYLNRTFDDQSGTLDYNYLSSGVYRGQVRDSEELLYTGVNDYAKTPDSDKDSHSLKARYDFSGNTVLSGSYVKADIESKKDPAPDDGTTYTFDSSNTLESEYTGYTGKLSTLLGPVRLSARANSYKIDGPEYTLTFADRADIEVDPFDVTTKYGSAESRDVTELGLDAVYRILRGTTLRLGYDYETVDRDEAELGETTTNTFKASVNSRVNRKLSFRGSYEYQDIDEPFYLEDGTGIGQLTGNPAGDGAMLLNTADYVGIDNDFNSLVYYWNSVYPNRELNTTNQPEQVNELKGSVTWSPSINMSATLFARYRMEENDSVHYSQDTFVPGVSFYYAPNGKMNLTMAYTFNKEQTENQMCVGWYHG